MSLQIGIHCQYLIDTLYYSVSGVISVSFIDYVSPNSPYSGVSMNHMTNSQYQVDPLTKISFVGYRIPTSTDPSFSYPQYSETLNIVTPNGIIVSSSTYDDTGNTFQSTASGATFIVLQGSDRYAYAKKLHIDFDDTVTPGTRIVKIYGYGA